MLNNVINKKYDLKFKKRVFLKYVSYNYLKVFI